VEEGADIRRDYQDSGLAWSRAWGRMHRRGIPAGGLGPSSKIIRILEGLSGTQAILVSQVQEEIVGLSENLS
jgi:hypothetical protein